MFASLRTPSVRFSSYINKQPKLLNYNFRSKDEFELPDFRINQVKFNFEYQALFLWNELPSEIKKSDSLNIFKYKYTDYCVKDYCSH